MCVDVCFRDIFTQTSSTLPQPYAKKIRAGSGGEPTFQAQIIPGFVRSSNIAIN